MYQQDSRKKLIIVTSCIIAVFLVVVIGISFLLGQKTENQFGKFITIKNYPDKVKGIANEVRDATQTYLYNVVVMNIDTSTTNASTIKDALIRDGSNSQKNEKGVYTGDYIVDIASIKQSYQVTYLYSKDDSKMGGNPIVVSCLPKDKLIYGEFNCKDIVSKQASPHAEILRYLPYQNFSFKLSPDATQNEKLTIVVTFDIPQSDLKGSVSSRQSVVSMYKNEVRQWLLSKNLNPDNYLYRYNYDDQGNRL